MSVAATYAPNRYHRVQMNTVSLNNAHTKALVGASLKGYSLHCIIFRTATDPAAGSGNFLTETYISLRRLENDALYEEHRGQMMLGGEGEYNPIQVSIGQFYGIEINDFAVTVAKTALWIAESQMMQETEKLMQINLNFLPLKSYANIVEGNALRIDWENVVPKEKLN